MKFNFPRPAKTKMTAIRLTEEDHEYMQAVAKKEGTSLPEAICVFLRAAIEEHKKSL